MEKWKVSQICEKERSRRLFYTPMSPTMLKDVSIPFKRESGWQGDRPRHRTAWQDRVSIPFKRESGDKDKYALGGKWPGGMFQFPSNGNAYHKPEKTNHDKATHMFPFPSNGKVHRKFKTNRVIKHKTDRFPFPSNGKAYHKRSIAALIEVALTRVSIPFKRESVSQVTHNTHCWLETIFSVSIPFKRESVSQELTMTCISKSVISFHSLQTGKRIQRLLPFTRTTVGTRSVSIPFKRESVSKALKKHLLLLLFPRMFPFPSNGKADPKTVQGI